MAELAHGTEGIARWLDPMLLGLRPETPRCCPTGSAPGRSRSRPPGCSPDLAVRIAFALLLWGTFTATWYARVLPGAHAAGAAGGLCLRRRGAAHRLRPRHGRRRAAGADRLPGPGPAGARDHAGAGPAVLHRRSCSTASRRCPTGRVGADRWPWWSAPSAWRSAAARRVGPGAGRRLRGVLALAERRLRQRRRRRPTPSPTYAAARSPRSLGATLLAAALAPGSACCSGRSRCRAASRGTRVWRDLRSQARLLLWFTWPAWPLALWTLWRWRRQLPARHVALPLWFALVPLAADLDHEFLRALAAARPAGLRDAGGLRPADLQAQRRRADRLVHAAVLQRLRHHHLGDLDLAADRRAGQAGRQRGASWRPASCPSFSAAAPSSFALAATLAWGWLVRWRTGRHRAALWKTPGAAGRRRRAVLAAGDDAVAAGAGLRAQLRAAGARHRRAGRPARLRRRARPQPAADRRAAPPRPASTCSRSLRRRRTAPGCW